MDVVTALAATTGVGVFLVVMAINVAAIFFPASHLGNVALQIFNPARDLRFSGRAMVTAPTPQPRSRHRFQDIGEDTRGMVAGVGSRP